MVYDVAVVGGGMAGLTSAAYLCSYGYKVVLCEQQDKVGGLVNSFEYKGFVLDGGIRAIENSGIIFPMLKQLGIEIPFVQNNVSLIIGKEKLLLEKENLLESYCSFLKKLFPAQETAVENIIKKIETSMKYMDVLYGLDNPLFVDLQEDVSYALSLLPWMVKYLTTIGKIDALTEPIDEYLSHLTDDPVLVDMFAQHFFYKTPAFFALSYFSLYLDYQYPLGGTGVLTEKMQEFILDKGGEICLNCTIDSIDYENNSITDSKGKVIQYKKMIWAADKKQLYSRLTFAGAADTKPQKEVRRYKEMLADKTGSDSIFTVYLTLSVEPEKLTTYMSPHVFYTPEMVGLSSKFLQEKKLKIFSGATLVGEKEDVLEWAKLYLQANTFEISCPAMRDKTLAPQGESALIISCLFDYQIMKQVQEKGYYEEFKTYCEEVICQIIMGNFLQAFEGNKLESFSSSPLTIERYTGNTGGSVTGWAFTNQPLPAVTKMSKIASSIKTKVPNVYQAGQWTFAPSGLPIAVLTGKLAADKVKKELR